MASRSKDLSLLPCILCFFAVAGRAALITSISSSSNATISNSTSYNISSSTSLVYHSTPLAALNAYVSSITTPSQLSTLSESSSDASVSSDPSQSFASASGTAINASNIHSSAASTGSVSALNFNNYITSYEVTSFITTSIFTVELVPSETLTYDSANGEPTLTLVGPETTVVTQIYPTVIASYGNLTQTVSLLDWDPSPYLQAFQDEAQGVSVSLDPSFAAALTSFVSFGRQPACTAAYSAYVAATPVQTTTVNYGVATTTEPNGQVSAVVTSRVATQVPGLGYQYCCEQCYLEFTEVQIIYWPAPTPNTACLVSSSDVNLVPSGTCVIYDQYDGVCASYNKRAEPTPPPAQASAVYATDSDGFVFTSPSVYVAFPLVQASDLCGQIGTNLSTTLAFAPGELSTVQNRGPGGPSGSYEGTTLVFNPADMPCGPNNGTNNLLPNQNINATGYNPIIAVPQKLIDLRPEWASCTADWTQGQDPPHALTPVSALVPSPTTSDSPVKGTSAAPSSSIVPLPESTSSAATSAPQSSSPPDPSQNSDPLQTVESVSHVAPPQSSTTKVDPQPPADPSSPTDPASSTPIPVPAQDPTTTHQPAPASTSNADADPNGGSSTGGDPTLAVPSSGQDPGTPINTPVSSAAITVAGQGVTPVAGSSGAVIIQGQTVTQGQAPTVIGGASIAIGSSSVYVNGQGVAIPSAAPAVTVVSQAVPAPISVGGQAVTPVAGSSGAVIIQGQTLTAGQGSILIGGVPVSIDSNSVYVNGQGASIPTAAAPPAQSSAISVGGIAVTPVAGSSGAVVIQGQTLTPGQGATNIGGVPVSIGSGSIYVNGQGAPVPTAAEAQAASVPDPIIVGGQTATPIAAISGAVVIQGQTITPGQAPTAINGIPISISAGSIFVNGQGAAIPTADFTNEPSPVIIGNQLITPVAGSSGAVIFQGQTLTQGEATTISGIPISLGSGSVFVNGQGAPVPTAPPTQTPFTVNNQLVTPIAATPGAVIFQGQTLTQGETTNINGVPVSLNSGSVFINGQGAPVPTAPPTQSPFTVNHQLLTPIAGTSGAVIFQGQILTQGETTTISGIPISLASGSIFVNGIGALIPTAAPSPQPITLNGQLLTPVPGTSGAIIFQGHTLLPSFVPTVINGLTLSESSNSIFVNGQGTPIPTAALPTTPTSYITINGETIGVDASAIVIDGTTLTPGAPGITVNGTLVSLGSSVLVVGTKTESLGVSGVALSTESGGVGAAIMSGLGQVGGGTVSAPTAKATGVEGFTGGVGRRVGRGVGWGVVIVGFCIFLLLV